MKDIVIVGASGFAREIKWMIDRINSITPCWNFLGYIDNYTENEMVIGNDDFLCRYPKELCVAIAIADPKLRYKLAAMYRQNKLLDFPSLIDPDVIMSESISMGKGNLICAGSILTVDVEIGDFCIINLDCTIGHEAILENFVTMNPSVNISGNTHLFEGVNMGTGSQIIQGRNIGMHTVIGAGAVVAKDIPSQCTAVGVPAKIIKDGRT